jgi:hypothetical protein
MKIQFFSRRLYARNLFAQSILGSIHMRFGLAFRKAKEYKKRLFLLSVEIISLPNVVKNIKFGVVGECFPRFLPALYSVATCNGYHRMREQYFRGVLSKMWESRTVEKRPRRNC